MAIPPYVGLSVSIVNNDQTTYSYTVKDDSNSSTAPEITKIDENITILPKKRSFDVAFLISPDDNKTKQSRIEENHHQTRCNIQPYESETIRSAFKKVGIGFTKFPESRTPSPIDPIRTPSPYETYPDNKKINIIPESLKQKKEKPKDPYIFTNITAQRPRFQNYQKELEKSPIFLGNNLINPVSVGLTRQNFIPAPIFGANPILPTSFVTASLLPPSLAALTLPAQNVCAKCNVSFRMTSDLVYHMRSHHKNDHANVDQLRRRRELDKLKCPVCNESFRERHHLTRHMTAHQDKEGDNIDVEADLRNYKSKCSDKTRIPSDYDQ